MFPKHRLKIALVSEASQPSLGGLPTYTSTAAEALAMLGHDVLVMSGLGPTIKSSIAGYRIQPLKHLARFCDGGDVFYQAAIELGAGLLEEQPAVIYAQDPLSATLAALVAPAGAKIFSSIHWTFGHWAQGRPRRPWGGAKADRSLLAFERLLVSNLVRNRNVAGIICVARYFRDEVLRLGVDPGKVRTILNAVNTRRFQPSCLTAASGSSTLKADGTYLILVPGRLIERKGALDAVKAMQNVPRCLPDGRRTVMVICGDDTHSHPGQAAYRNELHQAIEVQDLDGRVQIRRIAPDAMAEAYALSDLVVLPSKFEGLSTALLEAMACECPVIATDIVGHNEVVGHMRTGLLVAAGDREALARSISFAVANESRMSELGQAARRTIIDSYDAEAHARQLTDAFGSMVS